MFKFKVRSFDANDQEVEITIEASTPEVAENLARAIRDALRGSGRLRGGSIVESIDIWTGEVMG